MKIKLQKKKNPQKRTEEKFYANPVNLGKKTLRDIAHDIAGRSSVTSKTCWRTLWIACPITSAMVLVCS